MKQILRLVLFWLVCWFAIANAATNNGPLMARYFDVKSASQQLESIHTRFAETPLFLPDVIAATERLDNLEDDAKVCVAKSEEQVKTLNALLKATQLDTSSALQQADYQYLEKKKQFYTQQLVDCRLFVYRAQEALVHYKGIIQQLSVHQLLVRRQPVWQSSWKDYAWLPTFQFMTFYRASGLDAFTPPALIIGLISLLIAIGVGLGIQRWCHRYSQQLTNTSSRLTAFIAIGSSFTLSLLSSAVFVLYFTVLYQDILPAPILLMLAYGLFFAVCSVLLLNILLGIAPNTANVIKLPDLFRRMFYQRGKLLVVWLLFGYFIVQLFSHQVIATTARTFWQAIYVTVLLVLLLWTAWPLIKWMKFQQHHATTIRLVKVLLIGTFIIAAGLEWLGYHGFICFLLANIGLTSGLLLLASIAWYAISIAHHIIEDPNTLMAKKIHYWFGIKLHKHLNELLLIKFAFYLIVLYLTVHYIMGIWGLSGNSIDRIADSVSEGITIAGVKIIPIRLIYGLLAFPIILLFGRFIATALARKQRFQGEEETQVAISSIIFYITFALALLFALLIMGVNFTGLAIIAGALSVGIGLGLQNIVNNFVCGLILLLEKPIKPGDRVVIGATEGFVKKIRIRSTQITTLAKDDVIVPNAELIANQVTNYMFRDRHFRVVCQVGVAYGSDIELVRKVLLEVASQHSDVIQEAPNQPIVLFRNFGDSSLIFDLWCVIHDVNKKYIVVSELNFAIDKAFRQNAITIAFPQRDIHVKESIVVDKSKDA